MRHTKSNCITYQTSTPSPDKYPGKKKGTEKIYEVIIFENFPNIGKKIVNQVQEAQRVPYKVNPRRNMPRHKLIKQSKVKYKGKILKAAREKAKSNIKWNPHKVNSWSVSRNSASQK